MLGCNCTDILANVLVILDLIQIKGERPPPTYEKKGFLLPTILASPAYCTHSGRAVGKIEDKAILLWPFLVLVLDAGFLKSTSRFTFM
jgi:hypothetical protein